MSGRVSRREKRRAAGAAQGVVGGMSEGGGRRHAAWIGMIDLENATADLLTIGSHAATVCQVPIGGSDGGGR